MIKTCKTKYCRNKTKKNYCSKCTTAEWRKNNPEKSAYLNLKHNAKRRKKDFNISYEDFKIFLSEVPYLAKKGRFKTSMHIDRIDEKKGYTLDNIQILSNNENIRKYLDYRYDGKKMNFKVNTYGHTNESTSDNDCPF